MDKPSVVNSKLQMIVDSIWATGKDAIGDGSIMDAIRHERKNNVPVKGRHTITRLEKWLGSKTSPKPKSDNAVARMLIKEIRDALNS